MPLLEFARGVLFNLCVLLSFAAVLALVRAWTWKRSVEPRPWQVGLLFGVMAVVAMLFPVALQPGLFFDCRAGVIGTCALFGGPWAALASLPLPVVMRLEIGGPGVIPGVLELVLPAFLGSLFHAACRRSARDITLRCVGVAALVVGLGSYLLILALIVISMDARVLPGGPLAVMLIMVYGILSMGLLSALVLFLREHFAAIEALAESERRVRDSQKMAAIGQLSRKVAHTFMNSLGAIVGNAQMVRDGLSKPEDVRRQLDDIIETATRVSRLTGELLAFANPSPLRVRQMPLEKGIAAIRELLARTIGPEVEVAVDIEPGAGTIAMDPDQIEQAIVHLAVNGAEAMGGRGRLTVRVAPAHLSAKHLERLQAARSERDRHSGPFALLEVRDTGCGMDEETCSRMFEPFFTTKTTQRNAGLGLATVYSIVEMHNGLIEVASRPGRGTAVRIYLPVAEEDRDRA